MVLAGSWSVIDIVRPDGFVAHDVRPLVRLNVQIVVEQNGRRETGYHGLGGRYLYDDLFEQATWNRAVDMALAQALVNLESVAAPAGEMTVVLGPGWPGVLLHEAVGHGLEGDFNRKGTSAFSGRIGERVAAPGVTVIDDGSIGDRRGSLTIDDEGTPTQRNVLIEDGILKGYIQDRLNARLMGVAPTGNGRRENFSHAPMPRMTNTFMLGGNDDPREILARAKNGIYAKSFGGGQVDITSGKFVFSCTEAYRIENGRLGAPIKGATLIGDGPTVLTRVAAIGDDMALDEGDRRLRQGRPVGPGRRRPADPADRGDHRRRHRRVNQGQVQRDPRFLVRARLGRLVEGRPGARRRDPQALRDALAGAARERPGAFPRLGRRGARRGPPVRPVPAQHVSRPCRPILDRPARARRSPKARSRAAMMTA